MTINNHEIISVKERIYKIRPAGLPKSLRAPYWRGERAEDIVARRVKEQAKKKRLQAKKRRRKRKAK